MRISVNGITEEFPGDITVSDYLKGKSINPEHVVVEVNKSIVKIDQFQSCSLADGDTVEVLRFVGGG